MSIEKNTLLNEKEVLVKDFETLQNRIKQVEKDLGTMKSNLNAVYGAIQQIDKLLKIVDDNSNNELPKEKQQALNIATS
jgi:predicted nuclease with TOPRIM domain